MCIRDSGMVVDDAIVVLENVTTNIERGSDSKEVAVHLSLIHI